MTVSTIAMASITVADRLRLVDEDWARAIAASIEANGLMEPLVVRPAPSGGGGYLLVAGAHRHRALELLGRTEVEAQVLEMSDAEARLAEIDENLMRREMGALDRAIFLQERKKVHEELHPETGHGGDRKSGSAIKSQTLRLDQFTEEVAEKIGLSERTVQDAIEWVGRLHPAAISALRSHPLAHNAAQLKVLSRLDPAKQEKFSWLIAQGKAANIAEAKRVASGMPEPVAESAVDLHTRKLIVAWGKAPKKAQDRLFDAIGAERMLAWIAKHGDDEA